MTIFEKREIMTNRRRKVRKNYNKYHSIYHRHRRLNVKRIVISVGTLIVLGVFNGYRNNDLSIKQQIS